MSGPRGQFGTPVKQKEGSKYRRLEKKKKKKKRTMPIKV